MLRAFMLAVLIVGGVVVGVAGPAGARAVDCEVVVIAVTANDIQEDGAGHDDIWVKVGSHWFPTYLRSIAINEGQTLTNAQLGDPKDTKASVTVSIYEDDTWPNANDLLGSFTENCAGGGTGPGGAVQIVGSGGVNYTISYFSHQV